MNAYVRSILVITALLISTAAANAQTITLVSGNGPIGTRDPNTTFSADNGATFTNAFINGPIGLYSTMPGGKLDRSASRRLWARPQDQHLPHHLYPARRVYVSVTVNLDTGG